MIKSMTGYGRGEASDGARKIIFELRSVNHRYLDVSMKLPRRYAFAEDALRAEIKSRIGRGKIDVFVSVEELTAADTELKLNRALAIKYIDVLREIRGLMTLDDDLDDFYDFMDAWGEYDDDADDFDFDFMDDFPGAPEDDRDFGPDAAFIAGRDGVLIQTNAELDEAAVLTLLLKAECAAIDNFNLMRSIEGEKLAEDLLSRNETLVSLVEKIEERAPLVAKEHSERMKARISELLEGSAELPEDRIALEAAIFADKAAIDEETVRLKSHAAQLIEIVGDSGHHKAANKGSANGGKKAMQALKNSGYEPVGKKLDFLVQEMNREANTIGSKSNDLEITRLMLDLKSEIEKIREQVQNIE